MPHARPPTILILLMTLAIAGCEPSDERLIELARESADQQAAQNLEMARLNREMVQGTARMVESDAQARRQLLAAQQRLLEQEQLLANQRDALEQERRDWADRRRTESFLAPLLTTFGALLLALAPLALCGYLLHAIARAPEPAMAELLIQEFTASTPLLLPPPLLPALDHQPGSGPQAA